MLAIIARIELSPEHADAFLTAAAKVIEPTLAEPGWQLYAFSKCIKDPGVIWVSEQWDSEESLTAHLATDHVKGLLEETSGLEILSMDARKYDVNSVGPVHV